MEVDLLFWCVCVCYFFFFFFSKSRTTLPALSVPDRLSLSHSSLSIYLSIDGQLFGFCKGSGSYVRVISSTTTTTSRSSQMLKSLRQPSAERFFSAVYKHLFISDSRGYNKVETKKKTIRFAS